MKGSHALRAELSLPGGGGVGGGALGRTRAFPAASCQGQSAGASVARIGLTPDVVALHELLDELTGCLLGHSEMRCDLGYRRVTRGVAHRPTREEVLLLLDGELQITLEGAPTQLGPGDAALVPAGSELRFDGGANAATACARTTRGLEAVIADGTRITPPWAS